MQVEQGDKYLMTKKNLRIRSLHLQADVRQRRSIFGEITTGASNDIEQATKACKSNDHALWNE